MTIEEIKELIRVVQETGIAELEVQRGDNKVRIRRASGPALDFEVPPVSMHAPPAGQAAHFPPSAAGSPGLQAPPEAEVDSRDLIVKSPIVGTYYDAPSPGAPPFVKVGDHVSQKQVLCIIESMKLMNEIEAETAGILVAKFVDNGRPVEYGESLFSVRPQ